MDKVAARVTGSIKQKFGPNAVTTFVQPCTFTTWFNGDHPFQIDVQGNRATVKTKNARTNQYEVMKEYEFSEFFVGTSPSLQMTRFSGGVGDSVDGNTVLFQARDGEWVYVGSNLEGFVWPRKIVFFLSPMGNNDVPYPWARDDQGNIILFQDSQGKNELPVLRNSPPFFNLNALLEHKVDLREWAADDDKRRFAAKHQQETKDDAYPDPYAIYWFIMDCHRKKFKKDSLCAKYTDRLPVRVYHDRSRGRLKR